MHTFLDAKLMAKALRQALSERGVDIAHSACLEIVARQFGFADWNMLAAKISAAQPDTSPLVLPKSWFVVGDTDTRLYRIGLDPDAPGTALIACRLDRTAAPRDTGDMFATLMQSISAESYRGGQVRLTAWLRSEDIDKGSIWLRVDQSSGNTLAFDNLFNSPDALTGTNDWVERSIVLDVAETATSIHFGFLMRGFGTIRARDFRLEKPADYIAPNTYTPYLPGPQNLDFRAPDAFG